MAVTLRPGVVRTEESTNGSTKVTQVTSNGKDAKAIDEHEDANSPMVGLDLDQVDPPNTGNVAAGDADGGQGHEANASAATAASMNSPQQNAASPVSSVASSSADKPRRVHSVLISKQGYIVAYSNDGYVLSSYTLNGRFLRSIIVRERLYSLCLSKDGRVLLTGGEKGVVVLRWVFNLKHADDGARTGLQATIDGSSADDEIGPFSSPIRSMCFTSNERHLVVGLETGEIRVLAQVRECNCKYFFDYLNLLRVYLFFIRIRSISGNDFTRR
jgi:WD40 repeat protein